MFKLKFNGFKLVLFLYERRRFIKENKYVCYNVEIESRKLLKYAFWIKFMFVLFDWWILFFE